MYLNYPFSKASKSQSNIAATFNARILNALAFFGSTSNVPGNSLKWNKLSLVITKFQVLVRFFRLPSLRVSSSEWENLHKKLCCHRLARSSEVVWTGDSHLRPNIFFLCNSNQTNLNPARLWNRQATDSVKSAARLKSSRKIHYGQNVTCAHKHFLFFTFELEREENIFTLPGSGSSSIAPFFSFSFSRVSLAVLTAASAW